MAFVLRDVGLECFALALRGEDIGSVFSTDDGHLQPWVASPHERRFGSTSPLPAPFEAGTHRFASLGELRTWLGGATFAEVPLGATT